MTRTRRDFTVELPEFVLMRAKSLGANGQEWLARLNEIVGFLCAKWRVSPGNVLSGGSESLILAVRAESGDERIVKIGLPNSCDCGNEAKVLGLAGSNGYVELYDYDAETNALLLEKLGPVLASEQRAGEDEISLLCGLMRTAWSPLSSSHGLMTGAEKARWLIDFIKTNYKAFPHACQERTVEQALDFAAQRAEAHDDAASVLVHGDVHGTNTLRTRSGGYKFIDPDGLFADPACDLATLMRDWNDVLLEGDPRELGKARCRRLAAMTGLDEERVWQWGFVERVSTGLGMRQIGMMEESIKTLGIADNWV